MRPIAVPMLLGLSLLPCLSGMGEEPLPAGAVRRLGEADPKAPVSALAFSRDGEVLAVARLEAPLLSLWETDSGKALGTNPDAMERISAMVFTPDGKFLAGGTADFDGLTEYATPLLKVSSGGCLMQIPGRTDMGTVALVPGAAAHEYLVAGKDGCIRRVSLIPGGMENHETLVQDLKRPPLWIAARSTGILILDAEAGTLRLWNSAGGKDLARCKGPAPIRCATASGDGALLASADESSIRLWSAVGGREKARFDVPGVTALAVSTDQHWLAAGLLDGTVLLWNLVLPDADGAHDPPAAAELEKLWARLLEKEAFEAVARLTACPDQALPLMESRLQPAVTDEAGIAKRILELDHNDFPVREQASKALAAMGPLAAPALRKAFAESASAEVRERAKALLEGIENANQDYPGEVLRALRSVRILEVIGTPAARGILKRLAAGALEAPLTEEAREALRRLSP